MQVCPTCRNQFPAGSNFCPYDGHRLEELDGTPRPEKDELLGQLLDERYRLEARLGEGGMGVVYAGRHVVIDKPVAVKILRKQYSADARQSERFLREARAASRIGHPNIVDITDFGKLPGGQIYFVMELLVGHTLAWEVRRFGVVSAERCLVLGSQICRALAAAHAKGIVHRDLKPENIFIINPSTVDTSERTAGHPPDTIKLLDFGIAKFAWDPSGKRLTKAGSVFGTPQYMSPEQAAGKDADHRVDIYAMGCILYEMLTGELPFNADTFMGTLTKHMFEQPLPPRQLKPGLGIPAPLEAVVLKALEKQPEDRFQSTTELASALEEGCRGAAASAGRNEAGEAPRLIIIPEGAAEGPPLHDRATVVPPGAEVVRDEPSEPRPGRLTTVTDGGPPRGTRRGPRLRVWVPILLVLFTAGLLIWRGSRPGQGAWDDGAAPARADATRITTVAPPAARPDSNLSRPPAARVIALPAVDARRAVPPSKPATRVKGAPRAPSPDARVRPRTGPRLPQILGPAPEILDPFGERKRRPPDARL